MHDEGQHDLPLSHRAPRKGAGRLFDEEGAPPRIGRGQPDDADLVPPIAETPSTLPVLHSFGIFDRLRQLFGGGEAHADRPITLVMHTDDVLQADPVRGIAIRAGHFLYRGIKVDLQKMVDRRPRLPDDFDNYIDGFAWLRDLCAAAPLPETASLARRLIGEWIARCGNDRKATGWRSDTTGWRVMNIASLPPMIIAEADDHWRQTLLRHLADCERHFARQVDRTRKGRRQVIAVIGGLVASMSLSHSHKSRGW